MDPMLENAHRAYITRQMLFSYKQQQSRVATDWHLPLPTLPMYSEIDGDTTKYPGDVTLHPGLAHAGPSKRP